MIDMKLIRTNPELVKENIRKKFQDEKLPLVDEVLDLDKQFRETKMTCDDLRNQRKTISKKIGASNVRFYLSGNNLYTWTHLKTDSFDPEQNSPAAYPTMRTYNVGLNITF